MFIDINKTNIHFIHFIFPLPFWSKTEKKMLIKKLHKNLKEEFQTRFNLLTIKNKRLR